jgi:hypothetical protein
MLPLLETFLGKRDIVVVRSLRLLDEPVNKDHLNTFYGEQSPRNPIAEGRPDFPDRATQMIDTWLANRPLELHISNVRSNGLSLVLREFL